MKTAGIVLIVLGFGLTIFTGFKFFTKEKVVDIGKLEISREKPHYLAWSPVVGIILIGVGGVVLWKNSKS
jgi:cytochrome b subunit of formate dehydrogenase